MALVTIDITIIINYSNSIITPSPMGIHHHRHNHHHHQQSNPVARTPAGLWWHPLCVVRIVLSSFRSAIVDYSSAIEHSELFWELIVIGHPLPNTSY